jgi:hypothetical protein
MDKSEHSEHSSVVTQPLTVCPACGARTLEPVVEAGIDTEVHFFCTKCARCWHVASGVVWRMDPSTCDGCPERSRCTVAFNTDHRPHRR